MKKQIGLLAALSGLISATVTPEPVIYSQPVDRKSAKYLMMRANPHAASTQRKRRKYARQNPHSRYAKHKRG